MQNLWTVPADRLVSLPPQVPLDQGALVEPLAVAVHDVRRSGLRSGEAALVVGGGPVGLLIAAVARQLGAAVLLVEPNRFRLSIAESLGVTAVDPAQVDVRAEVDRWTSGAGVDVAFEVSGVQAGIDVAVPSLSVRGRLVMVAIHSTPRPVDLHRLFWRELTLYGARLYEPADFAQAAEHLAGQQVLVSALISRVVPLERAAEAFAALDGGEQVMKVLVDCRAARPTVEVS